MSTRSIVRIHIQLLGDFNADQVYHMENPNSPAVVFFQSIPPGATVNVIFNPLPLPGVILSGLIIIPPRDNTYIYSMSSGGLPSSNIYHPTNPSIFSMNAINMPLQIQHAGPTPITFQFIWV